MSDDFHPKYQAAGILHFVSLHEEKVRDEETAEKEERIHRKESLFDGLHGERVLNCVQSPDGIVQEGKSKVESVAENHLRRKDDSGEYRISVTIIERTQVILRNLMPWRQLRSSLLLEMLNNLGRFLLIENA